MKDEDKRTDERKKEGMKKVSNKNKSVVIKLTSEEIRYIHYCIQYTHSSSLRHKSMSL